MRTRSLVVVGVAACLGALLLAAQLTAVDAVDVLSASRRNHRLHRLRSVLRSGASATQSTGVWYQPLWDNGLVFWELDKADANLFPKAGGPTANAKTLDDTIRHNAQHIDAATDGCVLFVGAGEPIGPAGQESKTGAGHATVRPAAVKRTIVVRTTDTGTLADDSGQVATRIDVRLSQIGSVYAKPALQPSLLHEMGHVAGFEHTFQRPDRDQYVTVYHDIPGFADANEPFDRTSDSAKCMTRRHTACVAKLFPKPATAASSAEAARLAALCDTAVAGGGSGNLRNRLRAYPIDAAVVAAGPKQGFEGASARYLPAGALTAAAKRWCAVGACVFEAIQSPGNYNVEAGARLRSAADLGIFDFFSVMNYGEAPDDSGCLRGLGSGERPVVRRADKFQEFVANGGGPERKGEANGPALTDLDVAMFKRAYGCQPVTVHLTGLSGVLPPGHAPQQTFAVPRDSRTGAVTLAALRYRLEQRYSLPAGQAVAFATAHHIRTGLLAGGMVTGKLEYQSYRCPLFRYLDATVARAAAAGDPATRAGWHTLHAFHVSVAVANALLDKPCLVPPPTE